MWRSPVGDPGYALVYSGTCLLNRSGALSGPALCTQYNFGATYSHNPTPNPPAESHSCACVRTSNSRIGVQGSWVRVTRKAANTIAITRTVHHRDRLFMIRLGVYTVCNNIVWAVGACDARNARGRASTIPCICWVLRASETCMRNM